MRTQATTRTFEDWVTDVFDHPVSEPEWWFSVDVELPADPAPAEAVDFITRLCEHADEVLAPFSNAQLNQGFWYLLGSGASEAMHALLDERVPLGSRTRCIQSFSTLFARLFAVRCSPHLGHLDEPGADPLNSACYMWWDLMPLFGKPDEPARAAIDAACLDVMHQTLGLGADACRESALHGLGHWQIQYPKQVSGIIDGFLARTPELRPELRAYALSARRGCIL
jgi:hypothetical protein